MIGIKVKNQLLAQNLISFYPEKLEIFNKKTAYTAVITDDKKWHLQLPILYIDCPHKSLNINTPFSLADFDKALKKLLTQPIELKFYYWQSAQRLLQNKKTKQTFSLTQKEAELIDFLMQEPQHKADKETLLNSVWHYHEKADTHTLETHLYHLRKKLGEKAPPLIEFHKNVYHLL